jgi:hypothetical protein
MMSKWILGILATGGLGAGFVLAGAPRSHPPTPASAVEAQQLYQREVNLSAQESHLEQLLGFARAELARPGAPAPTVAPAPTTTTTRPLATTTTTRPRRGHDGGGGSND